MMKNLESRAALYSALAFGFAYPEQGADFAPLLSEMEDAVALAEQAEGEDDASTLRTGVHSLRVAIQDLQAAAFSPAEEYTYLFHRQALCPPYEATYSPAGMEQSLADIAGFYRAFGVQVSPEAHERVDHIGSQLDFMAVLCAKEAHALGNEMMEQAHICRDARAAFLNDHLGAWALMFAARVHEKARLPLYPALTVLLAALLASETKDLGVTLTSANGEPAIAGTTDAEELSCE